MRSNLLLEEFDFQIRSLANQSGVCAFGQIGSILVPANRCLEIFLLLVQCAQPPREIDVCRLRLVQRIRFGNLLIERFPGQSHPALLFQ